MTKKTTPTQDLTNVALDWAIASAQGLNPAVIQSSIGLQPFTVIEYDPLGMFAPSTKWAQGGPIIEREGIEIAPSYDDNGKAVNSWTAMMFNDEGCEESLIVQHGTTPLIAAGRAYVYHKLGPTVDVPDELVP